MVREKPISEQECPECGKGNIKMVVRHEGIGSDEAAVIHQGEKGLTACLVKYEQLLRAWCSEKVM